MENALIKVETRWAVPTLSPGVFSGCMKMKNPQETAPRELETSRSAWTIFQRLNMYRLRHFLFISSKHCCCFTKLGKNQRRNRKI
jgi:hypothetical protein